MTAPLSPIFDSEEVAERERLMDELVETVASGEALAFVGAGSSCAAGYPNWKQLVTRIAAVALDVDGGFVLDTAKSLQDQAQQAYECIVQARGERFYLGQMAQVFRDDPQLTAFHNNLVSLPFRQVLTTNYDLTLERAFHSHRQSERPPGIQPEPLCVLTADGKKVAQVVRRMVFNEPLGHVIHLHGCIEPHPNFVFCTSEYEKAYVADRPAPTGASLRVSLPYLPALISALLMTRRVVFVGYGHTDQYISDVLQFVADSNWEWEDAIHFAILPIDRADVDKTKTFAEVLRRKMGIATIFYESAGYDFSGGERLVERLAERVRVRRAAPHASGRPAGGSARPLPDWWTSTNARALTGGA